MSKLCPRCKGSLGDSRECPTCGFRMTSLDTPRRVAGVRSSSQPKKWQNTSWGRTLCGLLLSTGVFYLLFHLITSVISAADAEARREWWGTPAGLIMLQGLQAVSLLGGGMVAGAGVRRGTLNGTIVGVYNSLIFLVFYVLVMGYPVASLDQSSRSLVLVGLLMLQTFFGAMGGFIGSQIWKPIVTLSAAPEVSEANSPAQRVPLPFGKKKGTMPAIFIGPVAWFRVTCGTIIAVAGTIGAYAILKAIEDTSGRGGLDTQWQAKFITWEISVLAMFLGGAFAGSNTHNGMKQGLLVGTFATIILVAIYIVQGDASLPATNIGFALLGFDLKVSSMVQKIIFTILSVLPLGIAGGWFGGQLLPPVVLPPRRKRMLHAM